MSVFHSKDEVKRFVQEKSVTEKKPFKIHKTEPKRFVVKCPNDGCPFKLFFSGNDGGVFELVEETKHACQSNIPTIKRGGSVIECKRS